MLRKEPFWPDYTYFLKLDLNLNILFFLSVGDLLRPLRSPTPDFASVGRLFWLSFWDMLQLDLTWCSRSRSLISIRLSCIPLIWPLYKRDTLSGMVTGFRDVSTTSSAGRAGAGAYTKCFSLREPLDTWADNFDGEMFAIFMAIRAIGEPAEQNIVIFVDSQAAIKTISDYNLYPFWTWVCV